MKNILILIGFIILFFGSQKGMAQPGNLYFSLNNNGWTPVHFNDCSKLSNLGFEGGQLGAFTGNVRYTWKLLRNGVEIDQFIQTEFVVCSPPNFCVPPHVFFSTAPISGNYSIRYIARKYSCIIPFVPCIPGPTLVDTTTNVVSVTRIDDGLSCKCETPDYINISPSTMSFLNGQTISNPITIRAKKDIVANGVQAGINLLTLKAGEGVILKNGFHSVGKFHALIESCGGVRRDAKSSTTVLVKEHETKSLFVDELGVKIYPNPNNGQFTIELNNNNEENAMVIVYNLMGKIVYSQNSRENIQKINISEQPKGIYLVKVQVGEQVFNEKVIYQ